RRVLFRSWIASIRAWAAACAWSRRAIRMRPIGRASPMRSCAQARSFAASSNTALPRPVPGASGAKWKRRWPPPDPPAHTRPAPATRAPDPWRQPTCPASTSPSSVSARSCATSTCRRWQATTTSAWSPLPDTPRAFAVVGSAGRNQRVPPVAGNDALRLVAAASRNGKVDGIANFGTIEEMLEAVPEIEAASLCMPPQYRYAAAVKALAAGKHVFLEKPPGATLYEFEDLAAQARPRGVPQCASA